MEENRLAKWLAETYQNKESESEADLEKIVKTVDQFSIDAVDEDQLFEKIKLKKETSTQKAKVIPMRWIAAVAACIALIFGINQLFFQQMSISSPVQDISMQSLPDGSTVTLNGNSKIDFDNRFEERELFLDGEAFFEVEKGSSFIVNTQHGNIEVLGTSFNVFSRDSFLIVSCATGKVQVNTTKDSQILLPGQMARLSSGELILESVDTDLIQNWNSEETTFENTSLSIVLSSLSHYYDISIANKSIDISGLKFTGSFIHSDLDKAVKMVLVPFNIEYNLVGNKELILDQ